MSFVVCVQSCASCCALGSSAAKFPGKKLVAAGCCRVKSHRCGRYVDQSEDEKSLQNVRSVYAISRWPMNEKLCPIIQLEFTGWPDWRVSRWKNLLLSMFNYCVSVCSAACFLPTGPLKWLEPSRTRFIFVYVGLMFFWRQSLMWAHRGCFVYT